MTSLLAGHELLSLIIDEAPQATLVLSPDGHVLSWGRAAQTLFGWSTDEAVGQPLEQLTGLRDGGPSLLQLHEQALQQGVTHEVVKRRRKDGRLIHIEAAWRAVVDTNGALRCFIASKRDVSDEQLRRDVGLVGERYRDLLDSVPDAIVIVNDVGSIVLFNTEASQLFGVGAETMLGQPVESLIPERFARGHADHRERFAAAPQRRPMGSGLELRGRRGDGNEFPVEVSLSPLMIGERRFVMAALRDLSERVRLEEAQLAVHAAQRASTAKTEFLSRMSHELRTPLNAVLGFAQLLCMDHRHPLSDKQRLQVSQILRSGRHLLGMINDLLDVSRIESGAVALTPEALNLTVVLHEVLEIAQSASRDADLAMELLIDPPGLAVQADRLRLRQVLLNLVTNAIKYNRPKGRVDIRTTQVDQEVRIAVSDTGLGLTAEQLARLYQPFDRLGAEAGPEEGTGIGLVIARGLVQGMGGRIEVESEPGRGSVFTVVLPAAATRADATTMARVKEPAEPAEVVSGPELHALYVEDNEANVAVVRDVFALRPQWTLTVARDGSQALARVARQRPDLMIVDMHLPDMNGLELIRRLEGDPSTAGVQRVALSADATELRARAADEQGFERYFTKPLDIDAFLSWLDGWALRQPSGRA